MTGPYRDGKRGLVRNKAMESFLVFVVISLIFSKLWVMARGVRRMRREVGGYHHDDPSDPRLWRFGHGGGDFGADFSADFGGF